MHRAALLDLRQDARELALRIPESGHTLVFVPNRQAYGVQDLCLGADGSDFAAMFAPAAAPQKTLRAAGVDALDAHILLCSEQASIDSSGFVSSMLWHTAPPVTASAGDFPGNKWAGLCDRLWRMVAPRLAEVLPKSFAASDGDAPLLRADSTSRDGDRLLHWIAWSGQVAAMRVSVKWRLAVTTQFGGPFRPEWHEQNGPFAAGWPQPPELRHGLPLVPAVGWWTSHLRPAGESLIAVIDWLLEKLAPEPLVTAEAIQRVEQKIDKLQGGLQTRPMARPVRIAAVAKAAGMRGDMLLKRLRSRSLRIDGPRGAFTAELTDVIAAVPNRRKQILVWAEKNSPAS